jgi:hypothetical protein
MIQIIIKITGPGETFNAEFNIIVKALRDAGYDNIEIQNEYPNESAVPRFQDKTSIKVIADHHPWGG